MAGEREVDGDEFLDGGFVFDDKYGAGHGGEGWQWAPGRREHCDSMAGIFQVCDRSPGRFWRRRRSGRRQGGLHGAVRAPRAPRAYWREPGTRSATIALYTGIPPCNSTPHLRPTRTPAPRISVFNLSP